MKKNMLIVMVLLIASACNKEAKKSSSEPLTNDKVRISLNGIPYHRADSIVASFKKDSSSSDENTAIWLSKQWVENVAITLDTEKADGFRIYFGKDKGKNAVVIVSTKDDGPEPSESWNAHLDYFAHNPLFFSTNSARDSIEYTPDAGATLYSKNTDCTGSCELIGVNSIACQNASKAVKNFKKMDINTHCEWFSSCFLDQLNDDLNKAPANLMVDGIRIYFAYHDKSTNAKHQNRNAFIIVTTKSVRINGVNHHKDYYECYGTKTCETKPHGGGDNGEQCPNNCNGVTLPKP